MKQNFFTYLPTQVIITILSRLPIRTIISCKCVCKSWHDLLESNEFIKSHLSKSVPGLVVLQHKVFEFEDVLDLERHELHYNPITNFDHTAFITRPDADIAIQGTANGLLLLSDTSTKPDALYICNPITRDYIEFHCPQEYVYPYTTIVTYGFGASKMTGQHKVVRIFLECISDYQKSNSIPKSECLVYTLGTGSWRSIASGALLDYSFSSFGVFFNGNLHWLASDLEDYQWISCFDVETELFSTLSCTPGGEPFERLFVLEDCLCVCETTSCGEIVIWSMKEYGVEKSWTKELVFDMPDFAGGLYDVVCPIKVFKDGDILIAWEDYFLFYYANKSKTTHKIDMFGLHSPDNPVYAILHTPSFLSLESFAMENVRSF